MTGAKPRPPLIPGETRVSVLPLRDIVVALPGRAEIWRGSIFWAANWQRLLRELVPTATRVAVLVNPANAENPEREVEVAARAIGLQVQVVHASSARDINEAFATFARERPSPVVSSRARNQRTCRCCNRPNSSWS